MRGSREREPVASNYIERGMLVHSVCRHCSLHSCSHLFPLFALLLLPTAPSSTTTCRRFRTTTISKRTAAILVAAAVRLCTRLPEPLDVWLGAYLHMCSKGAWPHCVRRQHAFVLFTYLYHTSDSVCLRFFLLPLEGTCLVETAVECSACIYGLINSLSLFLSLSLSLFSSAFSFPLSDGVCNDCFTLKYL